MEGRRRGEGLPRGARAALERERGRRGEGNVREGARGERRVWGKGAADGWGLQGGGGGGSNRRAHGAHGARGGGGASWAAEMAGPRGGGERQAAPGRSRLGRGWKPAQGGRENFPFPFSYLALNSTPKYFSQITQPQARKSWSGMMQQPNKIFLGFTYTRYRTNSR
jgi:hypothetical protein